MLKVTHKTPWYSKEITVGGKPAMTGGWFVDSFVIVGDKVLLSRKFFPEVPTPEQLDKARKHNEYRLSFVSDTGEDTCPNCKQVPDH